MKDKSKLRVRFKKDKTTTLEVAQGFCAKDAKEINPKELIKLRMDAQESIDQGDFTGAMQKLERLRDAKTGVSLYTADKDGVPIIVRDARNAQDPPVRETEAFEVQMLNAIRGAIDVADIEGKPKLKERLEIQAKNVVTEFPKHKDKSQEELSKLYKKEIKSLGTFLEDNGIPNAYERLNVAKDFQNFNDKHSNIVTLSSVIDGEGNQHTVVEAEVAMKDLTAEQKQEYQNIKDGRNQPAWYKAMSEWEQKLCRKYAGDIIAGKHVMPTQLRQIAGMKNAFEKTTAVYNNNTKELNKLHASKHAGTVVSFARNKKVRQNVTNENAKQAKEWIGNKKLHTNTLNSGPVGKGHDPEIVKRTKAAMKKVGGRETNTAFNLFRVASVANDLTGVKATLKELENCFPKDDPKFKKIRSRLRPRYWWWNRKLRKGDAKEEIKKLRIEGLIDDKTSKILNEAIDLRRSVEKAGSWFRGRDAENASLATSRHLNKLTSTISNLEYPPEGMLKLPDPEEILRMCASGKDRTALAEHDQSAQAIATELGIDIKVVDRQLLKSGHAAQQAGGINAGGGTLGCFGTKEENRMGLPASRKKNLTAIIEKSAASNKIKGKSRLKESNLAKFTKSTVIVEYRSNLSVPSSPNADSKRKRGIRM